MTQSDNPVSFPVVSRHADPSHSQKESEMLTQSLLWNDHAAPVAPATPSVQVTSEIEDALNHRHCVVAIGISGGKDSTAVALATVRYLRDRDFAGRIVLIHADLGMVEWNESSPKCRELAAHLGLELIVVKRKAGGMMERWEGRWKANVARFANLECVKLILPWSTPSMRFCTSELKVAPITSELKKRFRGHCIVNVVGIRRAESCGRAKAPISRPNAKLKHKTIDKKTGTATHGYDWNAIATWTEEEVFAEADAAGIEKHQAYSQYGLSRVSCRFCIVSSKCDLNAAAHTDEAQELYRRQVDLEIQSGFSFQSDNWLGDVAPERLTEGQREALEAAKEKAAKRDELDATIPDHLLYVKGWPVDMPTWEEAVILANHRAKVGELMGIEVNYTTPQSVLDRYAELMEAAAA